MPSSTRRWAGRTRSRRGLDRGLYDCDIAAIFTSGCGAACANDADGDGAFDQCDNCPTTPNSGQEDVDGDGVGDACECPPDFNGDGFVNGQDFDEFVVGFEAGDPATDFDRDGFVTGLDFDQFVIEFEAGC